MYKYIQRDATVSWILFQELYMFRAFNHAHHQEYISV
jgi:hypothetical protein